MAGDEGSPLPHDNPPAAPLTRLLPVLPLKELCLFPGASLEVLVSHPDELLAAEMAERTGGQVLALGLRNHGKNELHSLGTVARVRPHETLEAGARRVELDGIARARVQALVGTQLLVAEVCLLDEGDEGDEWGPAVEALARYLFAHPELRGFLERQRRSSEPMAWVSLACQHLPITASARQRLLEADARERCTRISRGLDALLRKEQQG
jgi:Lon protease-like protein